jgi:hypothetical protein
MPYAILQTTLDPPSAAQLAAAFRVLPHLTALDAAAMAKDAFGILVQGLDLAQAGRLLQALQAAGVEAEMVDQAGLPPLPPPRPCRRAEVRPDAFVAYDHLGRPQAIEWPHVILLAAGAVEARELKRIVEERVVGTSAAEDGVPIVRYDHKDKEVEATHLTLELFLDIEPGRYRIEADKFHFGYLGDRFNPNRAQNYLALAHDCVGCAAGAVLNRGAAAVRDGNTPLLTYPSRHAFEEETVWLLWRCFASRR